MKETIAPLLRRFADEKSDHTGVVLVDDSSMPQSDVGALRSALALLWQNEGRADWANRAYFLQRVMRPN